MDINKFTENSIRVLQDSQNLAVKLKSPQIEESHLLYCLLTYDNSLIYEIIQSISNSAAAIIDELDRENSNKPQVSGGGQVYLSSKTNEILEHAQEIADNMKDEYVSVEHIFISILDNAGTNIQNLLKKYNINKKQFLEKLKEVRGNTSVINQNPEETYNVLKKYGSDLVELAKSHKLDPVIGRDSEIRNVIRILSRKTKNNPVLIGEAGVGKTAIAEGLAIRIMKGDVPSSLKVV